jgi:hypothetical protein
MFGRYSDEIREEGLKKIAALLSFDVDMQKIAAVPTAAAARGAVREIAKNSGGVIDFLATPFRNIRGGYADYTALKPTMQAEISALQKSLQEAATANAAGKATPEITESMAKNIWKKSTPIEGAAGTNTQQKIEEAKGRMIAGALQIGVPTVVGGVYLKNKMKKKAPAPVRADVPYNMQQPPQMYVITRNGVHHAVPDSQYEYLQKTSAPLAPIYEGTITGLKNSLVASRPMKGLEQGLSVGKLRRARGIAPTA